MVKAYVSENHLFHKMLLSGSIFVAFWFLFLLIFASFYDTFPASILASFSGCIFSTFGLKWLLKGYPVLKGFCKNGVQKSTKNVPKTQTPVFVRLSSIWVPFSVHFQSILVRFSYFHHTSPTTVQQDDACNAPGAATHPPPIRSRFSLMSKTIFGKKQTLEHFPHEPADNR